MKYLALSIITCLNLYASSYNYAHIYADSLVQEFDKEINIAGFDLSKSNSYKKLLASREFIESLGKDPNVKNEKSILEITDSNKYVDVVDTINEIADTKSVYPSSTKSGNITGNTFPAKTWSLTFDDGPRGERTKKIVDKLYDRGLEATFFMLTREVQKYLDVAKYVQDANLEVALHSYTHKSLAKASETRLKYEITQAKKDMEQLLDIKITNFRLPYGAGMHRPLTRKYITKNNLIHIFWNVDTLDWKDKNPLSVFNRTKKQMAMSPKDSGIILFHDIQAPTVVTSELVMDHLILNDYNVCSVQSVIQKLNGKDVDCIKFLK